MLITRKSPFTGRTHSMDLDITEEQLTQWENGELIQNVFPNLSADECEFIMTGITPQEWNATFGEEDV